MDDEPVTGHSPSAHQHLIAATVGNLDRHNSRFGGERDCLKLDFLSLHEALAQSLQAVARRPRVVRAADTVVDTPPAFNNVPTHSPVKLS